MRPDDDVWTFGHLSRHSEAFCQFFRRLYFDFDSRIVRKLFQDRFQCAASISIHPDGKFTIRPGVCLDRKETDGDKQGNFAPYNLFQRAWLELGGAVHQISAARNLIWISHSATDHAPLAAPKPHN